MMNQVEIMLGQAVQAFQNGDLGRAEKILKSLLQQQPNLLPGLQIMGLIRAANGDYRESVAFFKKAVKLNPTDSSIHYNLAKALSEGGRDLEALTHHEKATQLAPKMAEAWLNFSMSLSKLGRFEDALLAVENALDINPNYPQAISNKGAILTGIGRHEEALVLYEKALEMSPLSPQTLLNMGVSLKEMKRFDEALIKYDEVIKINPNYAEAYLNKGNVYEELKHFDEAIIQYDSALKINPRYFEALSNKGLILLKQKRFDDSRLCCELQLEIEPKNSRAWLNRGLVLWDQGFPEEALSSIDTALKLSPEFAEGWYVKGTILCELKRFDLGLDFYEKALGIKPNYFEAWDSKGLALRDLSRHDEAILCFSKAIELKPNFARAWANKGGTFLDMKRYEEAITSFKTALDIDPKFDFLFGHYLTSRLIVGNWGELDKDLEIIATGVESGLKVADPFALITLIDNPMLHLKAANIFAASNNNFKDSLGKFSVKKGSKIRVGYFSADFRQNHPVSSLISGMFEAHDRERFELYAFSHSIPQLNDAVRERLRKSFDQFLDTAEMTDIQLAKVSRELGIDIAIDLGGYTHSSRLSAFSCRVAPVQVSYLGYAGTTGAGFMDYLIADRTVIPSESRKYYSEKIAYLPNSYIVDDPHRLVSKNLPSRAEQGLPENSFVFCCFNNSYKITPHIIRSWSKILGSIANSVMWISANNAVFQRNLIAEFAKYQIDASRIIFAKREQFSEDHLARLQLADLFLDTVPYNAHTTAVDALRVGLPLVTYMGNAFAGRVAASLLKAIEMPELIAGNQSEYELLAINLANNPGKLLKLREKLSANRESTPLFNTKIFTSNIEKVYERMLFRYQNALEPDHIDAIDSV